MLRSHTLMICLFLITLTICTTHAMDLTPITITPISSPALNPVPIKPPEKPRNTILGFDIADLSKLAPITISMYCYNQFPKITMTTLSLLLILTILEGDVIKHKTNSFRKRLGKILQILQKKLIGTIFKKAISNVPKNNIY